MDVLLVTGALGLVGSTAVSQLAKEFDLVVGIDNDARAGFFGRLASGKGNRQFLLNTIDNYEHLDSDIRDRSSIERIFEQYRSDVRCVIHTAAQPSHDFAAQDPHLDFTTNALATLHLLEATRKHCPEATFVFTSTNKVYGDAPNLLPLEELETRFELDTHHQYYAHGIDEKLTIDQSMHSLFGVSKASADLMVQEYGRYFGLNTGVFRGGCLTGPQHGGAELHGFLSYLVKATLCQIPYTVYGYGGKQVRDNIHSIDLVHMFSCFHKNPQPGQVYNVGGSRHSNCSVLEAIEKIESYSGMKLKYTVVESNRKGDHRWWISDVRKFRNHYPEWEYTYDLDGIVEEMVDTAQVI